jgi:hypothetical protein
MGDVVEPMGAQFKNPMPLLWQHDSQPVGQVTFGKPTKDGIPFEARLVARARWNPDAEGPPATGVGLHQEPAWSAPSRSASAISRTK